MVLNQFLFPFGALFAFGASDDVFLAAALFVVADFFAVSALFADVGFLTYFLIAVTSHFIHTAYVQDLLYFYCKTVNSKYKRGYIMKKLIIALSTIFCAIVIMVSIYTLFPKEAPQVETEVPVEYTIRDYGGKVAVFEAESETPLVVYEIYTHLLPENDIELLRRGIKVATQEQLQTRLEDLGL